MEKRLISAKQLLLSLDGLTIFHGITADEKVAAFGDLLGAVTVEKPDCENIYRTYFRFLRKISGLSWKGYLVELLVKTENIFARQAAVKGLTGIDPTLLEKVRRDLKIISRLAGINLREIAELAEYRFDREMTAEQREVFSAALRPGEWPVGQEDISERGSGKENRGSAAEWLESKKAGLIKTFAGEKQWENNMANLAEYYREVGFGLFARYAAFRLNESGQELEGIKSPDPIRISGLFCQEREQSVVTRNTEYFLQGYPANNIILYGNRGTGKSSLVKALLNEYVSRGLRLVELRKSQINLYPSLVRTLSGVPLKFIIFIDDLSFDDVEEDYKSLKSLLEGGLEIRPDNVLLYATSNRKNLVRESFADRRADDVHGQDAMEEKLSLADRFGITVTFLSPDQESYLKIVEGLARQENIEIDPDELRNRALRWVMMNNGRSGRTARQFIDHLKGELRLF